MDGGDESVLRTEGQRRPVRKGVRGEETAKGRIPYRPPRPHPERPAKRWTEGCESPSPVYLRYASFRVQIRANTVSWASLADHRSISCSSGAKKSRGNRQPVRPDRFHIHPDRVDIPAAQTAHIPAWERLN